MTSKDDFDARLQRIQKSRNSAPPEPAGIGPASDWTLPRQKPRTRGVTIGFVVAGVLCLGVVGFAAPPLMAKFGLTVPFAPNNQTAAAQDGVPLAQAGFLDRLLGLFSPRETAMGPISHLPQAPVGWVRVTTADAEQPDALALVAARWPATNGGFDSHAGYGDLAEFVRIHDISDAEQRALSETRTRALYLGPEGQMLSLRLQFRSLGDTLGTAADPASWANALRPEVMNAAQLGDTVESFDLGGLTVFNRAAQGQVGAAQRRAAAPLDLTVALHPRAVMEIRGMAQPSAAIALIEGVDRAALSTRLSQK